MFAPKFTITPKLLANISQIERFYGQIEALRLPRKLELNLSRNNLIQSTYASNKIEGNPLTLPEVTNLLLSDRIPVNRSEKEVVNYFEILKRIEDYKAQAIDLSLVIDFHKQTLQAVDESAGSIRNIKVVVGRYKGEEGNVSLRVKHEPPHYKRIDIESDIKDLCRWLNQTDQPVMVKAGIFHHQFVYIHPFEDGNGRVCRLLTALIFSQNGYDINKYFILDDYYDIDRNQYSDALHSADKGDKTAWLEYFSEGVKYSLQGALFKAKEAVRSLNIEEQPTPKEKEVLKMMEELKQIKSQDLVSKMGISRQQAFNLLSGLLEKGLIDKKGSTKSSYYFIK
jgi:Fic family protein